MVRKSSSVSTAPDSLCLVTRSCLVLDSLQSHGLQPASLPCPPGFSRPEYWSGLPCPSPGDFPNPGIEPRAPALQVDSLPSEPPGKPRSSGSAENMASLSSVQLFSRVRLFATPWITAHQASLSISKLEIHPNSSQSSWWCHLVISSSVVPFSSCLQSFPTSGSFQMSQLFASGGQSVGVSASASVLPMNTQDQFPLGWTGWISLQSKELSRVFSNTTVQKHQFFDTQLSSWSNSHIHTWLLEKS